MCISDQLGIVAMQIHLNEEPQEEGKSQEVSAAACLSLLENEWRTASPDDLRRQLREVHELLIKARGLINKQRERLIQMDADIEQAMQPRPILKISKATRARWIADGEAALAELRESGLFDRTILSDDDVNFVKRLRGLLEAHGMTAAQLSKILDLDPQVTGKVISGHHSLTPDLIRKLSAHFALPEEYFL